MLMVGIQATGNWGFFNVELRVPADLSARS
jgi:hypothetical protein